MADFDTLSITAYDYRVWLICRLRDYWYYTMIETEQLQDNVGFDCCVVKGPT